MSMFNPPHPGEVLKALYLAPMNITVTEAALALSVARKTLSAVVNGNAGISPEMALRLAKALNTTPELWLNMQTQYDLWVARQQGAEVAVSRHILHGFLCGDVNPITNRHCAG
ncbi:MAG: HigA family addiction module antitoxin [Sulfuricellaceae bacterium]